MTPTGPKLLENGLPDIVRIITTTSPTGQAIISDTIPSSSTWQLIGNVAKFFLAYTTRTFPVNLSPASSSSTSPSTPADITSYAKDLSSPPGLTVSNGTVLRYVDMAPNSLSPMHKTVSVDYGVVLEGTIELVLDSGETRIMHRGDVCVQRATNHAWRNVTEGNGWGRMLFVLIPAEGGAELKEDLGGMVDVKGSD